MRASAGSPLSCASHRWGWGLAVVSRWGRVVQAADLAAIGSFSHASGSRRLAGVLGAPTRGVQAEVSVLARGFLATLGGGLGSR
jgi:hypothetical protein